MSDTTVIAEEAWNCFGNPNIPRKSFRYYRPRLLDELGLQCCLGFESEQCGIARDALLDVSSPDGLSHADQQSIRHLAQGDWHTQFCFDAMQLNDQKGLVYKKKKQKLIELWAEYGWTLVFVKTVHGMNRKLKQLRG